MISNNPDFSSLLQVGGKIFGVTHYESPNPAVAYLSEYEQNPKTGGLKVIFVLLLLTCFLDFTKNRCIGMR